MLIFIEVVPGLTDVDLDNGGLTPGKYHLVLM